MPGPGFIGSRKVKPISKLPYWKLFILNFILEYSGASILFLLPIIPFIFAYSEQSEHSLFWYFTHINLLFGIGGAIGSIPAGLSCDVLGRIYPLSLCTASIVLGSSLFVLSVSNQLNISYFLTFLCGLVSCNGVPAKVYVGDIMDHTNSALGYSLLGIATLVFHTVLMLMFYVAPRLYFKNVTVALFDALLLPILVGCTIVMWYVINNQLPETIRIMKHKIVVRQARNRLNSSEIREYEQLSSEDQDEGFVASSVHSSTSTLSSNTSEEEDAFGRPVTLTPSTSSVELTSIRRNNTSSPSPDNGAGLRSLLKTESPGRATRRKNSGPEESPPSLFGDRGPSPMPSLSRSVSFSGLVTVKVIGSNDLTLNGLNKVLPDDRPFMTRQSPSTSLSNAPIDILRDVLENGDDKFPGNRSRTSSEETNDSMDSVDDEEDDLMVGMGVILDGQPADNDGNDGTGADKLSDFNDNFHEGRSNLTDSVVVNSKTLKNDVSPMTGLGVTANSNPNPEVTQERVSAFQNTILNSSDSQGLLSDSIPRILSSSSIASGGLYSGLVTPQEPFPCYSNGAEFYPLLREHTTLQERYDRFCTTLLKSVKGVSRRSSVLRSAALYIVNGAIQSVAFTLFPFWAMTQPKLGGGFGLPVVTIGILLLMSTFVANIVQVLVYPTFVRMYKIVCTYQYGVGIFVGSALTLPSVSMFFADSSDEHSLFLILVVGTLFTGMLIGGQWTMISSNILLNNSCCSHERGTVIGFTEMVTSVARICLSLLLFAMCAPYANEEDNRRAVAAFMRPSNVWYVLAFALWITNRITYSLPKSVQRSRRAPVKSRYALSLNDILSSTDDPSLYDSG